MKKKIAKKLLSAVKDVKKAEYKLKCLMSDLFKDQRGNASALSDDLGYFCDSLRVDLSEVEHRIQDANEVLKL